LGPCDLGSNPSDPILLNKIEENIAYYQLRLEFIRKLFKDHQHDLLQRNADKIKRLVEGYNRFKNDENYDSLLAEFPQVMIFD
jgi:hypothetical protein